MRQLMRMDQGNQRHAPLVGNAHVDVRRTHLEEESRDPLERRRAPGINARPQPARPREQQQGGVIGVVVGMVMRDEHVADLAERHTGHHELPADTVSPTSAVGVARAREMLRYGRYSGGLCRDRDRRRLEVWKTEAMIAQAAREVPLPRLGRPGEVSGGPRVSNRED